MEGVIMNKVTILLMHYPGDDMWTATVPIVKGVVVEGRTPEIATDRIIDELELVARKFPEIKEKLLIRPEYLLTQVDISIK